MRNKLFMVSVFTGYRTYTPCLPLLTLCRYKDYEMSAHTLLLNNIFLSGANIYTEKPYVLGRGVYASCSACGFYCKEVCL